MEEKQGHNYDQYCKALFKNLPDAILMIHKNIIVDCNEVAFKMFGYKAKEELIGLEPYVLSPKKQLDGNLSFEIGKKMMATALNNGSHTFEWVHRKRNGTEFYCEIVLVKLNMSNKTIISAIIRDITERKKIQLVIEEKEKMYRSLFENNHAKMLLINPENGQIVDANPAACSFYGYTKKQIANMKITDINCLNDEEVFKEMNNAKLQNRNHFIFPHKLASGQIRDVEVYSGSININNQNLLYSIIHDISDKNEALIKLNESEKKFRKLFNNANDAIFLSELGENCIPVKVLDVNDFASKKLGYTREELLSILPKDITDENNSENIIKMANELKEKEHSTVEITYIAKDGTRIPFEVRTHVFTLNNKKVAISIDRDITERKKREEDIQVQKAFFQQLFKNSPEAIVILDNNDRIIDINEGFKHLFQYSIDDIRDRFINNIIAPDDYRNEAYELSKVTMLGGVVKKETIRKKKDGTIIDVAILSYPIIHNNEHIGIYAIYTDITEHKRKEKRMEHLAIKDSLTGLYNRVFFMDKINNEISKAKENNREFAVMFIDLDGFKSINDNLGHAIGDEVLKIVADRLNKCIGRSDILARMGGDEFTILLTNITKEEGIIKSIEKIMNTFKYPVYIEEHEFNISLSLGISLFPVDGESSATLITNADIAMYKAKEYSGNSFEFYTSSLSNKVREEFIIENGLRYALQRNEFSLNYQPIVDLKIGQIVGAEALIRWKHPIHGNIPPDKFISIAEKRGFINSIGEWVLKTACLEAKKWHKTGYPHVFVAVNISVKQLEQNDFVDMIINILNETKLNPRYLELEITESISMENVQNRLEILQQLKNIGVKLSMDDFGTGYSSLSQLNKLAISKLKIDRSFINDINIDFNNTSIVSTIIAIAKKLHLNVVAEGVETKEQLNFLSIENCDMVQGYFYSPPVAGDSFEKLLYRDRLKS